MGLQEGAVHEGFITEVALEEGKSQWRDCNLQKRAVPMSRARQAKLCCFRATACRDMAVVLEAHRWRVLGVSSV